MISSPRTPKLTSPKGPRLSRPERYSGVATGFFRGPVGDVGDSELALGIRHAATGQPSSRSARNARTRLRATRVGRPGSSTRESLNRVRRRPDARRVARRRVDLDPLEGCQSVARRVSNGSGGQPRSLVNRSPSTRRSSFARAVIVARSWASRPGRRGHAPRSARAWPAGS